MSKLNVLPEGSAFQAVSIDVHNREVRLRCGTTLPVIRYYEMGSGEQVHECELDLWDDLAVVAGPMANGELLICTICTPMAGVALPTRDTADIVRVQ